MFFQTIVGPSLDSDAYTFRLAFLRVFDSFLNAVARMTTQGIVQISNEIVPIFLKLGTKFRFTKNDLTDLIKLFISLQLNTWKYRPWLWTQPCLHCGPVVWVALVYVWSVSRDYIGPWWLSSMLARSQCTTGSSTQSLNLDRQDNKRKCYRS